jgi:hypothetical protein
LDGRQVADLVDNQQAWPAEEPNALLQSTFSFGTGKRTNEVGEGRKIHTLSGLHGFDTERCGEMAFACSRRTKEMNGLMMIDEAELRQISATKPTRSLRSPVNRRLLAALTSWVSSIHARQLRE